jgi:hypothetical protein
MCAIELALGQTITCYRADELTVKAHTLILLSGLVKNIKVGDSMMNGNYIVF